MSFDLEGDPVPPKLFLAPAKAGGAPPDADGTGGAAAPSAASPSVLAGGRRMGELDGIISRASGCRHRINTSVFNVSSVPRIGARSTGASPKGRIRPSHSNIISMEAVMDPAGMPTVCFIRI